jgi:hypothetical protein
MNTSSQWFSNSLWVTQTYRTPFFFAFLLLPWRINYFLLFHHHSSFNTKDVSPVLLSGSTWLEIATCNNSTLSGLGWPKPTSSNALRVNGKAYQYSTKFGKVSL